MIGQYFRQESIFRPYHWDKYTIKNILFYDNSGVVDSIGHGWVEYDGRDLKYIKLDIEEIKLKRKEDFSIPTAFIISKGKDWDGLQADLYINVSMCDYHFTEYKKVQDYIMKCFVGIDKDGQQFNHETVVKVLKEKYWENTHKLNELVEHLKYEDYSEENRNKFMKDFKKIYNDILKEQEYSKNYTVEDYLKEIK